MKIATLVLVIGMFFMSLAVPAHGQMAPVPGGPAGSGGSSSPRGLTVPIPRGDIRPNDSQIELALLHFEFTKLKEELHRATKRWENAGNAQRAMDCAALANGAMLGAELSRLGMQNPAGARMEPHLKEALKIIKEDSDPCHGDRI